MRASPRGTSSIAYVYYETFSVIHNAIAREKQLKRWSRKKKIDLIISMNPTWRDLSEDWGKPIEPLLAQTEKILAAATRPKAKSNT